jgi:hypothetical protein
MEERQLVDATKTEKFVEQYTTDFLFKTTGCTS